MAQTHRQTHRQTDGHADSMTESAQSVPYSAWRALAGGILNKIELVAKVSFNIWYNRGIPWLTSTMRQVGEKVGVKGKSWDTSNFL